jgi:hypothetical protein
MKLEDSLSFENKLRAVFEISPQKPSKPHKSGISLSNKAWSIKLGFIEIASFTSPACIHFDIGTLNKSFSYHAKANSFEGESKFFA